MTSAFDRDARRAIRVGLARQAYADGTIRLVTDDLGDSWWLVATHRGLFSVSPQATQLVSHGWFFGIDRVGDQIYLYENCGLRNRAAHLGRIIRLRWDGRYLSEPEVLITGLHGGVHQVKIIDDLLCVVDTANQRIVRFTRDGDPVDIKAPLPFAPVSDTSGAYHHINCIAQIDGRVAIMLHNGKAPAPRKSEVIWLDSDWQIAERYFIDGYQCHDIVRDPHGMIWHCASASGELLSRTGHRVKLSDTMMTRALDYCRDLRLVGLSKFGEREVRDGLMGEIVLSDRKGHEVARFALPSGPADVVALR